MIVNKLNDQLHLAKLSKILSQDLPGLQRQPLDSSNNCLEPWAGEMTQQLEHLLHKQEDQSSDLGPV